MSADRSPILSTVPKSGFIGRKADLSLLIERINADHRPLSLLSPPLAGASELLRQLFDDLFINKSFIPFYYEIPATVENAADIAFEIFRSFALQLAAFRTSSPEFLRVYPTESEILDRFTPFDTQSIFPIFQLPQTVDTASVDPRTLMSIPARLFARGEKVTVSIDGLHNCDQTAEGRSLKMLIFEVFNNVGFPVIFSGRRRSLHGDLFSRRADLNFLGLEESGRLIETAAASAGIEITETSRDLIARQSGGRPAFINSFITNAAGKQQDLKTFKEVQTLYAEELVDGGLSRIFESIIRKAAGKSGLEQDVFDLLAELAVSPAGKESVEDLLKIIGLKRSAVHRTVHLLNSAEIIRNEDGVYKLNSDDIALNDHLWAKRKIIRRRKTAAYSTRSLAIGGIILSLMESAPKKMAAHYRELSSLGLRGLMSAFDGRRIPASLFDHALFAEKYKGLQKDAVIKSLRQEIPDFELPDIAYSVNASSIYKPLAEFIEPLRSCAAFGFESGKEVGKTQVVWFAAEISSKLEAETEVADFWCDRLETAALMSGIENFRLWLIAPEGFTKDALEMLASRNCIGSNRLQVELLKDILKDRQPTEERPDHDHEFMMGGETEIAAANKVEQIAKEHGFSAKAINQMKTAIVEAFINAAEHSHSPDKKINMTLHFYDGKLVITVANRGIRLIDTMPATESEEKRRGWGLKLIKKLMDEVEITPVDDGTKIKMTKFLTS